MEAQALAPPLGLGVHHRLRLDGSRRCGLNRYLHLSPCEAKVHTGKDDGAGEVDAATPGSSEVMCTEVLQPRTAAPYLWSNGASCGAVPCTTMREPATIRALHTSNAVQRLER